MSKQIIILVSILIIGFTLGWFSSSSRTSAHSEDKKIDIKKDIGTHTTTTTTTTQVSPKQTQVVTVTDSDKTIIEDKRVESVTRDAPVAKSKIHISALAGLDLSLSAPRPIYGASISKDFIGPISIGAWGLTNGSAGVILGISF